MGGNGILLGHEVGRFVADAEAICCDEGTQEMSTPIVGGVLTGRSARSSRLGGSTRRYSEFRIIDVTT